MAQAIATRTCRRCGSDNEVDARQQLCGACRWELGLTGLESYRVAVAPIARPEAA